MITLPLPTGAQVLLLLHDLQSRQTLLSLANHLWPGLPPRKLCHARFLFPSVDGPHSPVQGLRRLCRRLQRCGHLWLPLCPGGTGCHGTGLGALCCPLGPVEQAPWPRLAIGPIWATVRYRSPPPVVLEVVHYPQGERVGIGRIFCDGQPAGTAQIRGDSEGIQLVFTPLSGREHLQPPSLSLVALEGALQDDLWSQRPAGVTAAAYGVVPHMMRREADLIVEMLDPAHGWALSMGEIAGLLQTHCGYNLQTAQVHAQMVVARGRGGVGDA